MPGFVRVREPGGWVALSALDFSEMEQFDADHALAVDSRGATYAPAVQAWVIGGLGVSVTGPFASSGGAAFTGGVVADSLSVANDVLIPDDCTISDLLTV